MPSRVRTARRRLLHRLVSLLDGHLDVNRYALSGKKLATGRDACAPAEPGRVSTFAGAVILKRVLFSGP
jgi:hypothetical protein